MPVTYSAAAKSARMSAILDMINGGSGPGRIVIGTSGMATTLSVIELNDPAGTVTGSVLTFTGMPRTDTAADAAGIAATANITDSAGNIVISGLTVTGIGAGGDIEIDSVTVSAGQEMRVTAGSITHA